jgi:hypothetical protein
MSQIVICVNGNILGTKTGRESCGKFGQKLAFQIMWRAPMASASKTGKSLRVNISRQIHVECNLKLARVAMPVC